MKKIIIILAGMILLVYSSSVGRGYYESNMVTVGIREINYKNHTYIVFSRANNLCVLHAEHCICRK